MNQLKTDILSFINARNDFIFSRWKEKIIMSSNRSLEQPITDYGRILFQHIFQAYSLPETERLDFIKMVSKKNTEIYSEVPTSFFVQISNIARNEIFSEINQYDGKLENVSHIYIQFSEIIDNILYYAIDDHTDNPDHTLKDKKQLTKESHEERLTLLGQMTSSFVHEFRNPLTTIHGFIQLLRSENPQLPYMDIISTELEELKFRITQFLLLSRGESFVQERSLFNLHELFNQIISFIYPRLLEFNVELERQIGKDLYVEGFIDEFRQVIINIIFNAIDVLSEQDSSSAIKVNGYCENESIILSISNTGPKIPDDLLATIFDPFVTTKKSGTGLGLYVCNDIIKKHNGELVCTSDDEWTTFTIIVPTANPQEEKRPMEN